MSNIDIQLEDEDGARTLLAVTYESGERIGDAIARLDRADELDRSSALEAAIATVPVLDYDRVLGDIAWPTQPIILRRVSIELHFEGEAKRARFPARAKWARVHRWGCRAFTIASDACAHLELREGSPAGPALNERQEIGPHAGSEIVWLVKPGPEPNG